MTESGDKKDGKVERKRQPKWAQVLTIVLSAIASSGITLGARERLIPPATNEQCMAEIEKIQERMTAAETRMTIQETKMDAAEKARQEEAKLRVLAQELRDILAAGGFGPGLVKYPHDSHADRQE